MNSYPKTPSQASQTRKAKPRQLAAASLSDRYGVSLPYARLIADLQNYRMEARK